jgi:hypothetical protein
MFNSYFDPHSSRLLGSSGWVKAEALVEVFVPYFDVNICQAESGSWCVVQRPSQKPARFFKNKDVALAFGRALAYSSGVDLYVAGPNGERIRQPKESLTYPIALD